jgi:DNA-binding CsgD family transcriptional regulator
MKRKTITDREREVFALVAQGLTTKEIAHKLRISPATVSVHVARVMRTLDARSRSHAVFLLYAPK